MVSLAASKWQNWDRIQVSYATCSSEVEPVCSLCMQPDVCVQAPVLVCEGFGTFSYILVYTVVLIPRVVKEVKQDGLSAVPCCPRAGTNGWESASASLRLCLLSARWGAKAV